MRFSKTVSGLVVLLLFLAPEAGRGEGSDVQVALTDIWGPPEGTPLLRVGGQALTAPQVLAVLRATHPDLVDRATDYLVESVGVIAEARRLGISITEEEIASYLEAGRPGTGGKAVAAAADALATGGPALDPQDQDGRLRGRAIVRALSERLIRYLAMREERATIGLIRVFDRKRAEQIRRKLARGADLRLVAQAESTDPSAVRGGVLAPIPRSRPTPLAKEAFLLSEGEISRVLAARDGERMVYFVMKVLRRDPKTDAPYSELSREIRAGLRLNPVTAEERFYLSTVLAEHYPVE